MMTLSIMRLSITILNIMTLSLIGINATLSINHTFYII
jgi:hypothetical protein